MGSMRWTRRSFLTATSGLAGVSALAACSPPATGPGSPPADCVLPRLGPPGLLPAPGSPGLVEEATWQATVDADALVFTTHPSGAPGTEGGGEDSGYWTGSASMPRSAQHDRVSIHCYWPGYEPIDLVAPGDARNVWICEVARAAEWHDGEWADGPTRDASGAFADFVAEVTAAEVRASLDVGGWAVSYSSPSAGSLRFGSQGPFEVEGGDVALHGGPRHRSAWGEICHLQESFDLRDPDSGHRVAVDFTTGAREVG